MGTKYRRSSEASDRQQGAVARTVTCKVLTLICGHEMCIIAKRESPHTFRAAMPSDLETAMEMLILVFHRYASKDGNPGTLSRRELRELMENELANFLKSQKDPGAIDKIMKDLDANGDGQVDFEEFVSLVVGLSVACEQCYKMHKGLKTGKK
ncbi:hypothetical protein CRENBAI_012162 [Crenichthys baileyi]|uniref:EF-hand domain-containing protein n=1 Tax=Crenichthys baileyi TaxID=28760 RepID=A0AAV9RMF5_9TELE